MSVRKTILLAEDEPDVREGLVTLLTCEGYEVRAAVDGVEALEMFRAEHPDLVLLDVMMPRKNGFAVCSEIRELDADATVLFLTAKDGEADEVRGLMLGADDYIAKTVSNSVKLARVARAFERIRRRAEAATLTDFVFGKWKVDATSHRLVAADGRSTDLTHREILLLRYFHDHPGEEVRRDFLLSQFWGITFNGNESTLSVAMSRLREKLGPDGVRIETVYGIGYRCCRDAKKSFSL